MSLVKKENRILQISLLLGILVCIWSPVRAVILPADAFRDYSVEIFLGLLAILLFKKPKKGKFSFKLFYFLLQLAIILPWGPVTGFSFLYLLKLPLLTGLWDIRHILHQYDDLHPVLARLIPLVPIVTAIIHMTACGWIWLGSGSAGPDDDKIFEYARALYWAVTTLATVGYGDISAKTIPQMIYASGIMIIGVGFFGFVLSNVASVLARLDAAREEYLSTLDRVENYMRYNHVPVSVRRKVRSYYRYLWDNGRNGRDDEGMEKLPAKLRAEISLAINAEIIERVPLFKKASAELLEDIMLELTSRVTVPCEKVFHVGSPGDALYFIHSGEIKIISKEGNEIVTLGPGNFFGETALLTNNPRNATAKSVSYSELYLLSSEAFTKVISRYPEFEENVKNILNKRTSSYNSNNNAA